MFSSRKESWHEYSPAMTDYLRIKKSIFYDEQEWNLPVDPNNKYLVLPEVVDNKSQFVFLYQTRAKNTTHVIGVARFTILADRFPHQDLFYKSSLLTGGFVSYKQIATINSVMLVPPCRAKIIPSDKNIYKLKYSDYLWKTIKHYLKSHDVKLVLLTTDVDRGFRYFRRCGFKTISAPEQYFSGREQYINMAYTLDEPNSNLSHYLARISHQCVR